ncbi:MAG: YneF family protein [Kyrpidia sp.]|nr:YneF family protein [Kyrpidia sp.]
MIYLELIGVFILGAAAGFALGVWYLRRQLKNTRMDEKQVLAMARSMGINLNQRQLQAVMRQMKQSGAHGGLGKLGFGKSKNAGKDKPRNGKRKTR